MKSTTWEKYLGSKSGTGKAVQKVTNLVGGKGITDYVGGRGTKMGAAIGVANVAASIGTTGAMAVKIAGKVAARTAVKKAAPVVKKIVQKRAPDVPTKIKHVSTQFFRNDIPGTKGYSAGYVKGKRIK